MQSLEVILREKAGARALMFFLLSLSAPVTLSKDCPSLIAESAGQQRSFYRTDIHFEVVIRQDKANVIIDQYE